ncbi:AzlD family protein [Asaia prunellae]|uniref:AzlD family protein n=1 Tax=Asaia prunellae TaxID=610245 RepID=UPI000A9B7635|nr:AzlD family protein [Asaia prunellae]
MGLGTGMTVHPMTLLAIISMACATFLTRATGYMVLGNRELSPRMREVLDAAPGCVLISVIAPHFVSGHPADLLAMALTILAAMRFSLLPTVIIGIASAGILRAIF